MLANYISAASLLVSALTLVFLIIYVRATGKIAKASVEQVEASFRPAIVAQSESSSVAAFPLLKNIGKGPAMQIEWSIPNSVFHGKIAYLEPTVSQKLPLPEGGPKILTNAAVGGGNNKASIECTYRSISGKSYSSSNQFDFEEYQFITHFSEEELS
ncbi:MAG: hypothetical protein WB683_02635 [Candidatus Sulfotelmatobacter sp.]